jgi:hypothetical protein
MVGRYSDAFLNTLPYPDLLMEFPVLASSVINPAFLFSIEPFSYAYFAAGNISVWFTPYWAAPNCNRLRHCFLCMLMILLICGVLTFRVRILNGPRQKWTTSITASDAVIDVRW